MELKLLIERAEKIAGSQKALALRIGQDAGNIRGAKAGLKGLPDYACVMIADLIGEAPITVIAASKLVTEKKEEVRKVWHPFVARAASVILGAVILNMTPAPAQAAPIQQVVDSHCILCQMRKANAPDTSDFFSPIRVVGCNEAAHVRWSSWPVLECVQV